MLPDKSRTGKRKSSTHRAQLNPRFDERFSFGPLELAEFGAKMLWLSVWHKDRLGRNELLGELMLPLSRVREQLLQSNLAYSTAASWYNLQVSFARVLLLRLVFILCTFSSLAC